MGPYVMKSPNIVKYIKRDYKEVINSYGITSFITNKALAGKILRNKIKDAQQAEFLASLSGINIKNKDAYLVILDYSFFPVMPEEGDTIEFSDRPEFEYMLSRGWSEAISNTPTSIRFIAYREALPNSASAKSDGTRPYNDMPGYTSISPSVPGEWTLSFDTEFSQAGTVATALDGTNWVSTLQGGSRTHGSEQEYYADSAVTFDGSYAILTASEDPVTVSGVTYPYTSGVLSTYPNFSQMYGLFEINCKMPTGAGYWPAFWMKSTVAWPPEIDVFEYYGSLPTYIYMTNHWSDASTSVHELSTTIDNAISATSEFHTYAVDWEPTYIKWYIDGILVATHNQGDIIDGSSLIIPSIPMYMIINLAISPTSSWNAPTSSTVFPQSLTVDYVRVWQPGIEIDGDGGQETGMITLRNQVLRVGQNNIATCLFDTRSGNVAAVMVSAIGNAGQYQIVNTGPGVLTVNLNPGDFANGQSGPFTINAYCTQMFIDLSPNNWSVPMAFEPSAVTGANPIVNITSTASITMPIKDTAYVVNTSAVATLSLPVTTGSGMRLMFDLKALGGALTLTPNGADAYEGGVSLPPLVAGASFALRDISAGVWAIE
jgi:beta-glucanase (GH16 family)